MAAETDQDDRSQEESEERDEQQMAVMSAPVEGQHSSGSGTVGPVSSTLPEVASGDHALLRAL